MPTRAQTRAHTRDDANKGPPPERQQKRRTGGTKKGRRKNGPIEQCVHIPNDNSLSPVPRNLLFRTDEVPPPPPTDESEIATQPLSRGGTVPSIAVQHLILTLSFAETHPDQSSNTSPEHQQNASQPSLCTNPLRNTRMGEQFHHPVPPTSSHPPNPSTDQTGRSLTPSHLSPSPRFPQPPLLQPVEPTPVTPAPPVRNRPRIRKPRGITKKGLKQSMGLHGNPVSRHAYNRFRVRNPSPLCSLTDYLLP